MSTAAVDRLNAALSGRYRIESELGEGGMATVYLADDLKHERKVALKVLKPELAAVVGAERFLAEIKTTANLQHPHILPLFDSGAADGFLFYVMPYVEGESLGDRLAREQQLPVDDALRIATDVAEALDYAHRQGVIHRDIKPANILLQDGNPVISDFGIALAVSAGGGGRLTETGLSLGTPHYMSPEQATGDLSVGPASDIYALGCVLYEMLVGEPPFTGSSAQAILGLIITGDTPSTVSRRSTVPPNVDAAIAKSLAKVPADRFRSARAFSSALADASFAPPRVAAAGSPMRSNYGTVGKLALAFVLGGIVVWFAKPSASAETRDIGLPPGAPMLMSDWSLAMDIGPGGDFVVYRVAEDTTSYLRYQSLSDTVGRRIDGTRGGTAPSISPDGESLVFLTREALRIVPISGGSVRDIGTVNNPLSVRWVSDTRLLLNDADGEVLRWFDVETRQEEFEGGLRCHMPQPLPNDRVLCGGGGLSYARVLEQDRTREHFVRVGGEGPGEFLWGSDFRLIDGAYLAYMSIDGNLQAVPFDPQTLTAGRPVTLLQGVRRQSYSGIGQFAVSADGTLAFAFGVNGDEGRLVVWREGMEPRALVDESAIFLRFDLSPDERQLAAVVALPNGNELRRYDLVTGQWSAWYRAGLIHEPLWLSSDRLLLGSSDIEKTEWVQVEGSPSSTSAPDTLLRGSGSWGYAPFDRTLDGQIIATDWIARTTARLQYSADQPVTILRDEMVFAMPSPDNRWLAYQPGGSGEVRISPYPALDRDEQIERDGSEPQWLSPSEIVYWRTGGVFYRAPIDPTRGALAGQPTRWHEDSRFSDTPGHSFTLTSDGGLVYVQEAEQRPAAYLRVIEDWVAHMKSRVDEANPN